MAERRLIDFHGHCGLQHNTHYTASEVGAFLTAAPVERILLSSLSSVFSSAAGVEDLLALKDHPKVIPLYWINPYLAGWSAELERLHEKLPICGVKLHPTANIYEIETEFIRPVFEHCREAHRFVCVHTDSFRSAPQRLTELVLDYPEVDVVLIHMDNPIDSIFLAKRCDNVYLETSWIERKWATLAPIKIALDSVAPEKIFFGTDFPYEFPLPAHRERIGRERSYQTIAELYHELLPGDLARRILYDNAKTFLSRYGVNGYDNG